MKEEKQSDHFTSGVGSKMGRTAEGDETEKGTSDKGGARHFSEK